MTETWCAALNALVLSIVAVLNGVLIRRTGSIRQELHDTESERRRP